MMVKPRSLDVERSLRESPRIENLKEEGVLGFIAREWELDVLITIWLKVQMVINTSKSHFLAIDIHT